MFRANVHIHKVIIHNLLPKFFWGGGYSSREKKREQWHKRFSSTSRSFRLKYVVSSLVIAPLVILTVLFRCLGQGWGHAHIHYCLKTHARHWRMMSIIQMSWEQKFATPHPFCPTESENQSAARSWFFMRGRKGREVGSKSEEDKWEHKLHGDSELHSPSEERFDPLMLLKDNRHR